MIFLIILVTIIGLWLFWNFFGILIQLLIFIVNILYHAIIALYTEFFVIKPMLKTEWAKQKSIELHAIDAKKAYQKQKEQLAQCKRIKQAGLIQVKNLRVEFPYADDELFEKYLTRFPFAMPDELACIETEIKNNNLLNEK